jgi:hypothetical protein
MEIYFVFFFPRKKRRKKPHPHCSTFASPTASPDPSGSQRSKPKLAKELQFCLRTRAKLLLLRNE